MGVQPTALNAALAVEAAVLAPSAGSPGQGTSVTLTALVDKLISERTATLPPQPRPLSWNERRDLAEDMCLLDVSDLLGAVAILARSGRSYLTHTVGPAPSPQAVMEAMGDLDDSECAVMHALRAYVDRCVQSTKSAVLALGNDQAMRPCVVCHDKWVGCKAVRCGSAGCVNAVHPQCFGSFVVADAKKPWYCWDCHAVRASGSGVADGAAGTASGSTSSAGAECLVCGDTGAAMKRTDDGRWVHIVCALYTPEVCLLLCTHLVAVPVLICGA
jgi:hypothetical protein